MRQHSSSTASKPAVAEAEKAIGGLLEALEQKTGDEVTGIALEDVVDTDPATGQPVLEKAVDIRTRERPARRWAR